VGERIKTLASALYGPSAANRMHSSLCRMSIDWGPCTYFLPNYKA